MGNAKTQGANAGAEHPVGGGENRGLSPVVRAASGTSRKRAASFVKRRVLWMSALLLMGWFTYNNLSLPSDWKLYDTLLREVEKHPGKIIRLKIKDIYPGTWQMVCFYGTYQGREEILRRDGIDIQPTRARIWAGSEEAATFLFIYADGTMRAQRVKHGEVFNADYKNSDLYRYPLSSCGYSNSIVEVEPNEPSDGYPYWLIFHPSGS